MKNIFPFHCEKSGNNSNNPNSCILIQIYYYEETMDVKRGRNFVKYGTKFPRNILTDSIFHFFGDSWAY
jgi:hypothetical protein